MPGPLYSLPGSEQRIGRRKEEVEGRREEEGRKKGKVQVKVNW